MIRILSHQQASLTFLNHTASQVCFIRRDFIGIMDDPVHDEIRLYPTAEPAMPLIKDKDLIVANPFSIFCQLSEVITLILKVAHQVRHPDI